MENKNLITVINFGGQYSRLICRRIRDLNVYSELISYKDAYERIDKKNTVGIILSGGPNSVNDKNSPKIDNNIYDLDIPILGICYGAQLIAKQNGGKVEKAEIAEFGKQNLIETNKNSILLNGIKEDNVCWMSHVDYVEDLPDGFNVTAKTETCKNAAFENKRKKIYALQFHPEVNNTENGMEIIKNFVFKICNAKENWKINNLAKELFANLQERYKDKKIICAFSGGVDSAVAAQLVHQAVGDNLTCVFVNHGFLRKGDEQYIKDNFKHFNLYIVDAKDNFLKKLKGVVDPEEKRKIIGEEFIRTFEEEAKKISGVEYLLQGTIYSDVIESGQVEGSEVIKSHHNVGGLPEKLSFKEIIEPLKYLFKDEVRQLGFELGLSDNIIKRQPFPGPGLAIRIIGEITFEKLEILREADAIFREEIEKEKYKDNIWQYFAVLTDMQTVGVMGDSRTYYYTIALRAVSCIDAMTADYYHLPYELLSRVSLRITNEIKGINRVVYDITSKPPATIEWE